MAEASVGLLFFQAKARSLVNTPGGDQQIVGPQHHFAVTRLAREADALVHQPAADTEPARLRIYQQHAQLGYPGGFCDQENRSHRRAFALGDPAALPLRIVTLEEPRHEARYETLEFLVQSVFA